MCADITLGAYLDCTGSSNVTSAARRAPAAVILRCAADEQSPPSTCCRTPSALWHHFEEIKPLVKARGFFVCRHHFRGIYGLHWQFKCDFSRPQGKRTQSIRVIGSDSLNSLKSQPYSLQPSPQSISSGSLVSMLITIEPWPFSTPSKRLPINSARQPRRIR